MILWLADRFSNLSQRHYLLIVVTIVVPVVFPTAMGYFEIEPLWVRMAIDVVVILLWAVFVAIVVSRLVERDTSEAKRLVGESVGRVADDLHGVRDEHGKLIAGMNEKVRDLEERTGAALEPLGGKLQPRTVNARVAVSSGVPTTSATGTVSRGSWWRRVLGRFRRVRRRAWGVLWGRRQPG